MTKQHNYWTHAELVAEIERLGSALGNISRMRGHPDKAVVLMTLSAAIQIATDALQGAPVEPSAQHFDPASVPDCPRCGVAHWPQCPEKSSAPIQNQRMWCASCCKEWVGNRGGKCPICSGPLATAPL